MGLLDWLTTRIGRDLDEQVHGSAGVARDRFEVADDAAELVVRARLSGEGAGSVAVQARGAQGDDAPGPVQREAPSTVELSLGPAKPWRGGELAVAAAVSGGTSPAALAVLTVEVVQPNVDVPQGPPLAFQTHSIEARFDAAGQARLELVLQLG